MKLYQSIYARDIYEIIFNRGEIILCHRLLSGNIQRDSPLTAVARSPSEIELYRGTL